MGRALLWLGLGLLVLVGLVAATAPELVGGAPGATTALVAVALGAGVPGLLVLGVVASKRGRARDQDADAEAARWRSVGGAVDGQVANGRTVAGEHRDDDRREG